MVRFMRLKRYARLSFVLVIPKILKNTRKTGEVMAFEILFYCSYLETLY